MHRFMRALTALFFIVVIIISAIVLVRHITGAWRADLTQQKLYTLSDGSKAILGGLNQPITLKLYYAKTAAMKAPDMIRDYNNYAQFVKELLGEYVRAANGSLKLEIIDPRPFSKDEEDALKYRLQRHQITEEESFFFGLVVQTPFGVTKSIPFFTPDRRTFVEYDVSQLIDSAVRRQKKRVGVLSSLPVMGEDMSGYMAQMKRMQGQPLQEPWIIIQQLRQRYEVTEIQPGVEDINPADVDVLLVIHPKEFTEPTLFAIDQYLMKGGKAIVCVDPHAWVDQPDRMAQMSGQMPSSSSNMPVLLKNWGLEMKEDAFAGDRSLAIETALTQNQRPGLVIGFLNLKPGMDCYNLTSPITANLNDVVVMMAGSLSRVQATEADAAEDKEQQKNEIAANTAAKSALTYEPLWQTSNKGNTWSVSGPYDLMMPNPARWLEAFSEGHEPVVMGYLVSGEFSTAFPNGIDVTVEAEAKEQNAPEDENESAEKKTETKHLAGLTTAEKAGAAAVFADVDFISDMLAYQRTFFGAAARGDNATCVMNAVDFMAGSSDLISIRSRGGFQRPFKKVEEIEAAAAKENEAELANINKEIEDLQNELNEMAAKAKSVQDIIAGAEKLQETRNVELKIHNAEMRRREVQLRKNEDIEALKSKLMWLNIASAPVGVLLIAVILALARYSRRRSYISHTSDA